MKLRRFRYAAAMAQLVIHNQRITQLEDRIHCLRQRRLRQRRHATGEVVDSADLSLSLISGHYDTWQRWVEHKLLSLNSELAMARAAKEAFVAQARLSFGRKSATEALLKQHQEGLRAAERKRGEQLL